MAEIEVKNENSSVEPLTNVVPNSAWNSLNVVTNLGIFFLPFTVGPIIAAPATTGRIVTGKQMNFHF